MVATTSARKLTSIREQSGIAQSMSRVFTHVVDQTRRRMPGVQIPSELGPTELEAAEYCDMLNAGMQGRLTPQFAGAEARAALLNYHFLARWRQFGFPVFRLTHGLVGSLVLTDCRGLRGRDLVFPFGSFSLDLPGPDGVLSFVDTYGDTVAATRAHVHVYDRIALDSIRAANDARRHMTEGAALLRAGRASEAQERIRTGALTAATVKFVRSLRVSLQSDNGNEVFFDKPLPTSDEQVERILLGARATDGDERMTALDSNALGAAARMVINLAVYLAEQPSTAKWRSHAPRVARVGDGGFLEPTTWVVGQEVKLPSLMREAAAAFATDGTPRAAWRVRSRFITRGHWRNQVCGAARLDRKRIWIQPHWKGPLDGPGLTRLYTLTDQPEVSP